MRKGAAYTGFMLALTCCSTAHAAKNVEVVRYRSLFMFGGISQSAGASFSYSQHKTENSSSSGTSFRESYSLGTAAAVFDPHILTLELLGGVSYSQNFGQDSSSTLLNGEYNILGSAFDLSYHPMVISSSRTTSVISNGYTPTYSITTNTQQISAALSNLKLPLQGYYIYSTSETSGLDNDSSATTNSFGFSTQHYTDRVDTRFSFNHGRADSEGTASSSYSVQLSNNLSLDARENYRLSSSVSISDTDAGDVPQRDIYVTENLNMKFGRALAGALAGSYNSTTTEDFEGDDQRTSNTGISASLTHMLYQSLSTTVSGTYMQGESLGGETSSYGGALRIGYTKILPAQSLFNFSVDRSTSVQSQDLLDPSTDVRERFLGVVQDQLIPSPSVTGRVAVLQVSSFSPLASDPELQDPAVPVLLYFPDIDYAVETSGAVRILPGGRIANGSNIEISYSILANNNIEMRLDSTTTSAALALFGGRYNFSGTYGVQSQTLISGEANNQGLVDSNHLSLTAAANYHPTLLGMDYSRQSSSQETSSRISAYGTHSLTTDRGESMSFSVRDTYSMLESDQQGNSGSGQNTLSLSGTYTRRIYRFVNLALSLGANDSRGSGRYSDFINARFTATGAYNQLQFSLSGQTLYRIAGGAVTRDSNITGSITRFF